MEETNTSQEAPITSQETPMQSSGEADYAGGTYNTDDNLSNKAEKSW